MHLTSGKKPLEYWLTMSLPLDARGAIPSSPQELVAAAKDARDRFLRSTFGNRWKSCVKFYFALAAAYSAVVGDETLGKKFNDLVDQTVNAIPGVQSGRINREIAKQPYRVDMKAPPRALVAVASRLIDGDQDVLLLLEKAAAPNVQAK